MNLKYKKTASLFYSIGAKVIDENKKLKCVMLTDMYNVIDICFFVNNNRRSLQPLFHYTCQQSILFLFLTY